MSSRNIELVEDEYYHVYNRGTDKRNIVTEDYDYDRFLTSLEKFNSVKPIGSIYENSFIKDEDKDKIKPLVEIVAYCLNPNHFHLILKQKAKKGIEKFLHRQCTGYSKYFNHRYKRKGTLFQGKFSARHIEDNDYLLHASAYVNLNDRVHQLGRSASKLPRSSLEYYKSPELKPDWLHPEIVLDQFKSSKEYCDFAEDSLGLMLENKLETKELNIFDGLE